MAKKSKVFSITVTHDQYCSPGDKGGVDLCSLLFACAACGSISYVTLEASEAGIALSNSIERFFPVKSARSRLMLERLKNGKLSISCSCFRTGRTVLNVSLNKIAHSAA